MNHSSFGFESTAEEVTEGVDLRGKTWLITGVNSGLGYESARVLAMRGAHIVGAARTLEKAANALASLNIDGTPLACDLSDIASVRAAVETVKARGITLDGILANAGIMALPELKQQHGYELQFFTNHVGHFALVTGLLDQLTESGRVVMLSSGAHRMVGDDPIEFDNLSGERDYHPWRMYAQSKLANILFANSLAARFQQEGSGRTANSLHPGVIRTNLARHIPDAEGMFERMTITLKSVPQGAATQCYVAVNPEAAAASGRYFSDCAEEDPIPAGRDAALAERLWTRTEAILAEL